jgi:membrane protein DedA with SNARE-associated domain
MDRMLDLGELIGHWGYMAILLLIVLGNIGFPVPEETTLALAGYLVWRGQLRLSLILAIGIVSATAGDNLGYWLGRRYGRAAIERHSQRILLNPERLQTVSRFVMKHGFLGVFVARFIPGLRFVAGPLAGVAGLPVLPFVVANTLGALLYVPYAVGIGYAVGYELGTYVERVRHVVGEVEYIMLIMAIVLGAALIGWRMWRARHPSSRA